MNLNARLAIVLCLTAIASVGLSAVFLGHTKKPSYSCHDFAQGGRICILPEPIPFELLIGPPKNKGAIIYCTNNTAGLLVCGQ